jgi:putative SOS response-associated peptidase YedK
MTVFRSASPAFWENWRDEFVTCTIITTDASEKVTELHDRQPMMLDEAGIETWLAGGEPELPTMVTSGIRHWPVSPEMNKVAHNEQTCIEPLVA